jgi:hypothetical protein
LMISILRISFVLLLSLVASVASKWVHDKTELYKQYPQLIDPEVIKQHPCAMGMSRYFTSVYDTRHQEMW